MPVEQSLRRALGLHQVLPAQQSRAAPASAGARRFFGALLLRAVDEAGLAPRRSSGPPQVAGGDGRQARRRAAARTLARRWLCGELDDQVTVTVAVACSALGLDAEALADAVRARTLTCNPTGHAASMLPRGGKRSSHQRLPQTRQAC